MTPEEAKLYEKIQKLINLKEGAEEVGSMEEAGNAQAQIQKLVLKHNLDLSKMPGKKAEVIVEITKYKVKFIKTESDWIPTLLNVIGKNNMGKIIMTSGTNAPILGVWMFDIIASKINTDIIIYIFEQLLPRIKSMRAASFKKALEENPGLKKNGYFRSYSREVVYVISWKLQQMNADLQKAYEGGSQLIVTHDAAINEKVSQTYGSLRSKKASSLGNAYGARDGKRDGHAMQINKGLN